MSVVKIVKMKNGDELITSICGPNSETWEYQEIVYLKKPCILLPTADNQMGIAPWGFMTKEATTGNGIPVNISDILYIGTPLDELLNQYNTIFGSKLIIPDKTLKSGLTLSV